MKVWDRIKERGDDVAVLDLLGVTRVQLWRWYQREIDLRAVADNEREEARREAFDLRCQLAALRRDTDVELAELRDRAVIDAGQIGLLQEAANQQRGRLPQPDWSKATEVLAAVQPGGQLDEAYQQAGPRTVACADQQLSHWRDSLSAWGLNPDEPSHLWAVMASVELMERWAAMGGLACAGLLSVTSTARVMTAQLASSAGVEVKA